MKIFNVRISDATASKRAFGWPLLGTFSTTLPVDGRLGFLHGEEATVAAPPAPAEVEEYIESELQKLPKGRPVVDPEKVQRRLHYFRVNCPTPTTRGDYRFAIEALALEPSWLPASPVRDAVAAEAEGVHLFGAVGNRLDAEHAAEVARRRFQAETEEAARAEAARPNTKSLAELGLIGVFLPTGTSPTSWPAAVEFGIAPFNGLDAQILAAPETSPAVVGGRKGHVVTFRAVPGVTFPAGPIEGTSASIVTDIVLPRAPAHPRELNLWTWGAYRAADDAPITTFRDGRTAEGEHAERCLRERFAPHVAQLSNPFEKVRGAFGNLFFQMAIRGYGLRKELVAAAYREFGGPASEARIDIWIDEAIAGTRAWYSPDELFTAPAKSFVDRFIDLFRSDDPWGAVIDGLLASADVLSSEAIEAAILEANLHDRAFTNAEHERVRSLMSARGFTKKRITIDGEKVLRFVRST